MTASYELYQEQILDHYKNPRNKGVLEPADLHASESNPLCGDRISLTLRVDGVERITEVRFDGQGCAISQASASMLTTMLLGRTLAQAKALRDEDILKAVGVPLSNVRVKCALLSLQVLHRALGPQAAGKGS